MKKHRTTLECNWTGQGPLHTDASAFVLRAFLHM